MSNYPAVEVTFIDRTSGEECTETVQIDHRDVVRAELIATRKGWPNMQQGQMLTMTLWTYAALLRGKFDIAADPEAALDSIVALVPVEGEQLDPTQQAQ